MFSCLYGSLLHKCHIFDLTDASEIPKVTALHMIRLSETVVNDSIPYNCVL